MLDTEGGSGKRKAEGGTTMGSDDVSAQGRGVAIAADEYAKAVTEAAGVHQCAVARLIAKLMDAETMAAAARIKVELTTVQNQYESVLMTENDWRSRPATTSSP